MKPTDSELEILKVIWSEGPSTVRTVNEKINEKREVGYTTTLKIMQIMFEKNMLERTREGKTHIYSSCISEEDTLDEMSRRLLNNVFGGSAKRLVMSVLGNGKSSSAELKEIREYLEKLDKNSK